MLNSKIEWTEATWNPTTGCTRVGPGCEHCYATRYTHRLACMGQQAYVGLTVCNQRGDRHFNGVVRCHEDRLEVPARWRKPTTVFVNSMSDLFHEKVPHEFIQRTFAVMTKVNRHTFQILTKRSRRLVELSPSLTWTPNIWMGVSVENVDYTFRIDHLRETGAAIKFLSLEPLLGPLPELNLTGIDWVIVGGESGPGARCMDIAWVREIRDQCQQAGIPFFFKQFGHLSNNPDSTEAIAKSNGGSAKGGRLLDGRLWDEMPPKIRDHSLSRHDNG